MSEFDEFAEALFGQLSVEINEEREIQSLHEAIPGDSPAFEDLESVCEGAFLPMRQKTAEFLRLPQNGNLRLKYLELAELKKMKGRKVFCGPDSEDFVGELFDAVSSEDAGRIVKLIKTEPAKYLVYSTYAIQYISKITTTYGDYMDDTVFVNKFILKRYPGIVLHKMGNTPSNYEQVLSGYRGAVKMTILEECVHSLQGPLYEQNRQAAVNVNTINERLAQDVLDMDESGVKALAEYLQLQAVPDDFPFARRANLFFFLNPDHFLTEQIGPDIMTYTHIQVDPKISGHMPQLAQTYTEWLPHIQRHHAAFTVMEGMAAYALKHILSDDQDYARYRNTFDTPGATTYQIRKDLGMSFVESVVASMGDASFETMLNSPPLTAELKDPAGYVGRVGA